MLVLLMGGICVVHRWDGLRWHGVRTKFHKDWFRHSKVSGGIHEDTRKTHTHTYTHRGAPPPPPPTTQQKTKE
jgi:hypothetical protein